jgi:hypothetical protein
METTNMETNNDNERRELEALRLSNRATRSINQLEVHRKSVVREYAERVKRLRKVVQSIQQREQMGLLPMEGLDHVSIGEEDMGLVHDPLRGL